MNWRFHGASTPEVTDARNESFFFIMVANDIRGWIGAYVFSTFVLQLTKTTGKTDPAGDQTQVRWPKGNNVTPRPQRWSQLIETIMARLPTYPDMEDINCHDSAAPRLKQCRI